MNRSTRPRQIPVSCQLCREKKLKCDRQHPCSNCSARAVDCQPATRHAVQPQQIKHLSADIQNTGILDRLQKLEDAVFGVHARSLRLPSSQQLERSSPAVTSASNDIDEEHRTASKWLEGIGTREDSLFPEYLNDTSIPLKLQSIDQMLADLPGVQDGFWHYPGCVQLPSKPEAISLFRCYLDNVHPLHPVIDSQSVQQVIDAVYINPHTGLYNKPAHIALLLSIFASASHLWRPQDEGLIFTSGVDATLISSVWTKNALDVLEYSRRTTSGSIEDIQATIIISYVIHNIQGFSPTLRSLHSIIIMMARDLSLHKTDNPRRGDSRVGAHDDIKRRIWWQITSTDWLLAFSPGPQEGTYSIQPAHMCVNYPQNQEGPESTASPISYLLQRIRLSEICRTIVDSLPRFLDIESIHYAQITALDSHFEDLITTLPPFFHLNQPPQTSLPPQILTQRYLIHLGIHIRRSKLHQPFLVRGFAEPKYAYSRNTCLRSAHTVLEVFRTLDARKDSLACIPGRLGTVVHHVFMATVALVMDLCFNNAGHDERRLAEVMGACSILEDLTLESAMAKRFLLPLMAVLQKHSSRLRSTAPTSRVPGPAAAGDRDVHAPCAVDSRETLLASNEAPMFDNWGFDQMMQNYIDLGPTSVDGPVWDDLLAEFDSCHAGGGGFSYG